jgi:hypothetical protein
MMAKFFAKEQPPQPIDKDVAPRPKTQIVIDHLDQAFEHMNSRLTAAILQKASSRRSKNSSRETIARRPRSKIRACEHHVGGSGLAAGGGKETDGQDPLCGLPSMRGSARRVLRQQKWPRDYVAWNDAQREDYTRQKTN